MAAFCAEAVSRRVDETLRPLEYPTVVLEVAAAAVLRMEEGLVGVRVCFRGIKADAADATRDLGGATVLLGAELGLGAASAAAASRDRMVGTWRTGRTLVEEALRWVDCRRGFGTLAATSSVCSVKLMLSNCFMIVSLIMLSHLTESSWNLRCFLVRPSLPISCFP